MLINKAIAERINRVISFFVPPSSKKASNFFQDTSASSRLAPFIPIGVYVNFFFHYTHRGTRLSRRRTGKRSAKPYQYRAISESRQKAEEPPLKNGRLLWKEIPLQRKGIKIFYYAEHIACDISGMPKKSAAENPIGAAGFLIM